MVCYSHLFPFLAGFNLLFPQNQFLAGENEIYNDHYTIIIILLIAVVFLVTSIFLYLIHLQNRKANRKLAAKNQEIEERKLELEKLLHKLEENKNKHLGILKAIPDMFFILDENGVFRDYYAKNPDELYLPPEEFLNKSVSDLFSSELSEQLMRCISLAREKNDNVVFEYSLGISGVPHSYEARLFLIENGQVLLMVRDMTSYKSIVYELEKAKEEALKATESKSLFLASLSHEIRTPLSSIIGISGILEETDLTEDQREYVDVILISGNNLLSLINNILDFSKIEAGQIELEKVPFNLKQSVYEVIRLLAIKVKETSNKINLRFDESVPDEIVGDVVRLKQILINLLNNALKFTKNGEIDIVVQLFDNDESKLRIKFSVIDTGIGVAIDQRDKLFKSFSQADPSIARKYGGTGLGLAICKYFTTMMGGEIGVHSEPGKGSNFWFTALFDHPDKGKPEPSSNNHKEEKGEGNKTEMTEKQLHILLVEDNLLNQKFAEAILKKNRHIVDIAPNGKIGVELYQKNHYDLILMDIQMPVMDGITATRTIREIEKAGNKKPIRIIAVTAYAMEGDEKRFFNAGINDYLRKPYKAHQLIEKLSID